MTKTEAHFAEPLKTFEKGLPDGLPPAQKEKIIELAKQLYDDGLALARYKERGYELRESK